MLRCSNGQGWSPRIKLSLLNVSRLASRGWDEGTVAQHLETVAAAAVAAGAGRRLCRHMAAISVDYRACYSLSPQEENTSIPFFFIVSQKAIILTHTNQLLNLYVFPQSWRHGFKPHHLLNIYRLSHLIEERLKKRTDCEFVVTKRLS